MGDHSSEKLRFAVYTVCLVYADKLPKGYNFCIREFEPGEFQLQLPLFTPSSALEVYKTWSGNSSLLGTPGPSPSLKKTVPSNLKKTLLPIKIPVVSKCKQTATVQRLDHARSREMVQIK